MRTRFQLHGKSSRALLMMRAFMSLVCGPLGKFILLLGKVENMCMSNQE